jgi:AcrR family transcriptional regulator
VPARPDRRGGETAVPGKRERLVASAGELLYRHGVEETSLADIAEDADVPLGNVYYYFKTKDALVAAVVDAHVRRIEAMTAQLDRGHRSPKARLKGLIAGIAGQRDTIAGLGCPYGTLCGDLAKRAGPEASPLAQRLIHALIDWSQLQFGAMGRRDARDLAVHLVAGYQGAAVVASALGDPEVVRRESRRLRAWIDSIES